MKKKTSVCPSVWMCMLECVLLWSWYMFYTHMCEDWKRQDYSKKTEVYQEFQWP